MRNERIIREAAKLPLLSVHTTPFFGGEEDPHWGPRPEIIWLKRASRQASGDTELCNAYRCYNFRSQFELMAKNNSRSYLSRAQKSQTRGYWALTTIN